MLLQACGRFKYAKKLGSAKHKKTGSANSKSAKCHIFGRSATNYLSPQICGFATHENYLQTAHLWDGYTVLKSIEITEVPKNFPLKKCKS
jgi:hypothetical protein